MGFWSTLGKIGKIAAPIAASFIPGLGPVASALLSGGIGAATNANKGVKGMLTGAGLGAAGSVGGHFLDKGIGGLATKLRAPSGAVPGVGNAVSQGTGQAVADETGGVLSKIFGKQGLDPMMLAMMGLSAIPEGDDGEMQSFRAPGENTDPRQSLAQALEATLRTGQGMQGRGPVRLRSSVVAPPPSPVSLQGIPFQIGGGLGRDPAIADPSLLEGSRNASITAMDPFQSLAQTTPGREAKPVQRKAPK